MGRGLRVIGFPGVSVFRDRHGKQRFRYRVKGRKAVYLAGVPGSPEFADAYARAVDGAPRIQPGAARTVQGSIHALAVEIYASAEWERLSTQTRVTYRGIIERLRRDRGHLGVAGLRQEHVLRMRDEKRHAPTSANNLVKVLRFMMAFAVDRRLRADNPCLGIKPLRVEGEGFHTWSEDELAQFQAKWPVGTRERLAFDLLLWTVQRSGDVRLMGRQHVRGGRLEIVQEKTGAELSLPILAPLRASLDQVPAGQLLFIQTEAGAPFTAKGFGNWFSAACRAAGLVNCSAHGLRKSGATRLADAGCSEAEIMAWTGHQTTKEVQRYTRARDQKRLADRAAQRTQGEQTLANPTDRLAKSAPKGRKRKEF